jgi:hypothetical protein
MSFGNSLIFPFPAVQYIPLPLTLVRQGQLRQSAHKNSLPQLILEAELKTWKDSLVHDYGIALPESVAPDAIAVLTLNMEVENAKYRGYFVTFTGKNKPGFYQINLLPRRFFYKKNLIFEFYESATSKRLVRQALNLGMRRKA